MIIRTLIFVLLSLGATAQEYSFNYGGIERTYTLRLPFGYDPEVSHALVLSLHGLGSNAFQQQIYTNFDPVADTAGIVMVYPNGVDNTWNISGNTGVDDVGFLSALIDTVAANYSIDLYRVYATGMSMGGFMSHRLGCELSDRIAAIASVTGLLAYFPCQPSRPVPVLQIHGTNDDIVPYSGVENTINHWTGANGCYPVPQVTDLPDTDTTDGCTVTLSHYNDCSEQGEVMLYTINGGEHTWPGATIVIGVTNYDIHGSSEIWKFFRRHSTDPSFGTEEASISGERIRIYPNPLKRGSMLTIEIDRSIKASSVELTDFSGRIILKEKIANSGVVKFNVGDLHAGLYIVKITSPQGFITRKLTVR